MGDKGGQQDKNKGQKQRLGQLHVHGDGRRLSHYDVTAKIGEGGWGRCIR